MRGERYASRGEALTLTEWSQRTGLSRQAIRHRLAIGWSIDDALWTALGAEAATAPPRRARGRPPVRYTSRGETQTLDAWSARVSLAATTIAARLRAGWPVDDAIWTPRGATYGQAVGRAAAVRYSAHGHVRTLREWSDATGVPLATLRSRTDHGWSIEDALATPSGARRRRA